MRHIFILVGLALPVVACTEPAHWSKGEPAESTEVIAERPAPAPEARTELEVSPPEPAASPAEGIEPSDGSGPIPGEQVPGDAARAGLDGDAVDPGAEAPAGAVDPAQSGVPSQVAQHPAPGTIHGGAPDPGSKADRPTMQGQTAQGQTAQGQTAQGDEQAQNQQDQTQKTVGQRQQAQQGAAGQAQAVGPQTGPGQLAQGQTTQGQTTPGQAGQGQATKGQAGQNQQSTATSDKLVIRGPVTQGGLVLVQPPGKVSRVTFPGHRVHLDEDGSFLVAFARTAPASQKLTITLADGTTLEHAFQVAQRTYEKETINNLREDELTLDPSKRAEHADEDGRIHALRLKRSDIEGNCVEQGFAWPAKGRISSRYGQPRYRDGEKAEMGIHWGVDIAVPTGTPVTAPACGKIVFANADVPLSGGTLVIDHGRGVTTSLLHLSGFEKKVGDMVKKGEVVARSGESGRVTGAHLDWRMNFLDVRIDPELLVQTQSGTM